MKNLRYLNEYRAKISNPRTEGELTKTEKYFLTKIYEKFSDVHGIASRQLGESEYSSDGDQEAESFFFGLLSPGQKKQYPVLKLQLENILNSIKPLIE